MKTYAATFPNPAARRLYAANPGGKVIGTVIEAELDRSRGVLATLLVQNGTLESGDVVVAGTSYGKLRALSDFKGKVVLLDFWATWCAASKVEMPWYVEFETRYRNSGLAVIGVSMKVGASVLTRILCGASSIAIALVKPSIACLVAQ